MGKNKKKMLGFFSKKTNETPVEKNESDGFLTNIQAEADRFKSKANSTPNNDPEQQNGSKMSNLGNKLKTRVMFWKNEEIMDSVNNTISGAQNTAEKMQYG